MENNTVWHVNFYGRPVHNQSFILRIHMEKCHIIGFMVQGYHVFIIGKQAGILGIFSAHGQTEQPGQKTCFLVHAIEHCGIVSCIGTQQKTVVIGKGQCTGSIDIGIFYILNRLYLLKDRIIVLILIGIYINIAFPLMYDINKSANFLIT